MLLTVLVQQQPRPALVLPELALIQIGRQAFVFRVRDDNTVEQVPVSIGARRRGDVEIVDGLAVRSEEHTSELQSLMRISYAVFCLKKKTRNLTTRNKLKNDHTNTHFANMNSTYYK